MNTAAPVLIDSTASEINEAHRMARQHAESAVQYAIRCGELLMRKKAELRHGEFKPWIAANCEFSYSSANAYMKAAQQKSRGLDFSSLAQALDYDKPAPEVSPIFSGTPDAAAKHLRELDLRPRTRKEQQAQFQESVEIYAQTRGITSEAKPICEPAPQDDDSAWTELKAACDEMESHRQQAKTHAESAIATALELADMDAGEIVDVITRCCPKNTVDEVFEELQERRYGDFDSFLRILIAGTDVDELADLLVESIEERGALYELSDLIKEKLAEGAEA